MEILQYIAAIINIGFGVWTLAQPEVIAKASGWSLLDERGTAELRIAFGGYFIGMGLAIIILNDPQASGAIGIAWLGAAFTRLTTLFIHNRAAIVNRAFFIIWASEILTGAMLVAQLA